MDEVFGNYNYKIYLLEGYNITKLLIDIVDKHIKIRINFNICEFLKYIE